LDAPWIRQSGELVSTTWSEALDDLAARLQRVVDAHGPDAVGLYTATFSYLDSAAAWSANALQAGIGTTSRYTSATIDSISKVVIQAKVTGHPELFPFVDVDHARMTVLVGTNPVVSHGATNGWPDPLQRIRRLRT